MKSILSKYVDSFRGLSKEVWLIAMTTLINRSGTMVVPFLSLYLTRDMNLSLSKVGWVMTVFGLGSIFGAWLGGKLTDLYGYYKIMIFSLGVSGCLFLGLQYLDTFATFSIGIFFLMAVADMYRPAMYVALNAYSKPENKTRSITLNRLAINLGFSVGSAMGGFIIINVGYNGLFWIDCITCIVAAGILFHFLNARKTKVLDISETTPSKSALKDYTYLLFLGALTLFFITFLQFFSTMPLYYKEIHGLSEFHIGLLFGVNGLLIFLFEMPLIKYCESLKGPLLLWIITGAVLILLSFMVLLITSWVGVLLVGVILMTFGEMMALPFMNTFALRRAMGGNKGQYMALYTSTFSLATIVGHNTGLHLTVKVGYENTWLIIIGIMMLCLLILFYLKNTFQNPEKII